VEPPTRECRRIFGKARQGVENLAALSATHLTAGNPQCFRRQFEDRLAF
jgi:hypothetical protein